MRIKAFKGLRPKKELVEKVASPPYDVLGREEARKLAMGNPFSFLHVIKPEIDLPENVDIYDEKVYRKGAENLRKFIGQGILVKDDGDYLYIYRQIMENHSQTGLVVGASCWDYIEGRIKKHELTREVKEMDRTNHIIYTNANTGPVFLIYRDGKSRIKALIRKYTENSFPEYDFASDGIRHTFWVVGDLNLVKEITDEFSSLDNFYIADGHHRAASAARVARMRKSENSNHTGNEEYNYFLAVVFPHDEVKIMPYNRVVRDLGGLTSEKFVEMVKEKFEILDGKPSPEEKQRISMYLNGKWHLLIPKSGTYGPKDPVSSLDVSILQENLLSSILKIENPRKDSRINFVGGIKGTKYLEKLVDKGEYRIAFSMYPTSIEELLRVADQGRTMPPKSTWFEPKLKSGLVVHLLE